MNLPTIPSHFAETASGDLECRQVGDYHCLVVDPPWPQPVQVHAFQGNGDQRRRSVYPPMTLAGIRNFDIRRWAAEDCHVFVWATQVSVQWVYEILRAWGVQYRCTRTWWKHKGVGTWRLFRDTEFLVYGTIGSYQMPLKVLRALMDVPNNNDTPHSEKPQEIYDEIAAATPGPRIDIFSRQERAGFDSWGWEAPGGCHDKDGRGALDIR